MNIEKKNLIALMILALSVASYGCSYHIVRPLPPPVEGEERLKPISGTGSSNQAKVAVELAYEEARSSCPIKGPVFFYEKIEKVSCWRGILSVITLGIVPACKATVEVVPAVIKQKKPDEPSITYETRIPPGPSSPSADGRIGDIPVISAVGQSGVGRPTPTPPNDTRAGPSITVKDAKARAAAAFKVPLDNLEFIDGPELVYYTTSSSDPPVLAYRMVVTLRDRLGYWEIILDAADGSEILRDGGPKR